ncbi:hypothetical protein N7468_001442, partial [Penicillium chermesinum]
VAPQHLLPPGSRTRPYRFVHVPKVFPARHSVFPCRRNYSTAGASAQSRPMEPAPSQLDFKTHDLGWEKIQAQVEPYFGEHWNFASEKEKQAFYDVGFSRAFSCFFPLTLEDRVEATCRMHYLPLLIDDQLDNMNLSDMLSYRARIIQIARRQSTPNKSVCVEWMLADTIQLAQSIDEKLANELVQGFCSLLMAQTAPERTSVKDLGSYLEHREIDVGRPFYTALIRFGANLDINSGDLKQISALESYTFRFLGVLNDIYSWEKEWKAYQARPTDGSHPFSAIHVLSQEIGLSHTACKRLMYSYCRELEASFKETVETTTRDNGHLLSPDMERYVKGLEYLMSGFEKWHQWTPRYRS